MSTNVMFSSEKSQKLLTFEKSPNQITLKEARQRLIQEDYFCDKDGKDCSNDYRYVYPTVDVPEDDEKLLDYSDRVLGITSEKDITIDKMFLPSGNEIVLTNIHTGDLERPNLIGFRTSFWSNGNLQVTCRLRPGHNDPNVPEPYLLNDVITSRKEDFYSNHYPHVLVCTQNAVIEFPVACKCTVGMAYSAWMNGERIFDYASPLSPYQSHDISYGCADCFNNGEYSNERLGPKEIKVEKLSASDIDSKDFVSYSITFTADDVTQWSSQTNGVTTATYTENSKLPIQKAAYCSLSALNASPSNGSSEQFVLDQNSYFAGKIIPGKDVPKLLPGVNTFSVDKIGSKLGTLSVAILVFKDMDTANKYVARYNPLF